MTLLLPLDDLLAVVREFLCESVSRSGLDRCLRRHGVGNVRALLPQHPREPAKGFTLYEPGYLHTDIKYLPQMLGAPWMSNHDRSVVWLTGKLSCDKLRSLH